MSEESRDFIVFDGQRFGSNMQKVIAICYAVERGSDKTVEEVLEDFEQNHIVKTSFMSAIKLAGRMIEATRLSKLDLKDDSEEKVAEIILQMIANKNRKNK